ncbi:MAG: hypothetical protein WC058_07035 [Phycisphaeraceae bacterium]
MTDPRRDLIDPAAVAEMVRRMNEDELRRLNHLIVERLKLIAQARSTAMLARFGPGDHVCFPDQTGQPKTGRILRLNRKTATILTDDHQQWNVSPALLTRTDQK